MKQYIDKADLGKINFEYEEVLTCPQKKHEREYKLLKSVKLGNLYKQRVKISFKNRASKILQTSATVWAVTESFVLFKGGLHIPKKSILSIELL